MINIPAFMKQTGIDERGIHGEPLLFCGEKLRKIQYGVLSGCLDHARIKWAFVMSTGGNETEFLLEKAPTDLDTLFNSIYGRDDQHIVLRKPLGLCRSNPCLNGGTCNETFDGFYCTCQDGYEGSRCDESSPYIHTIRLLGSAHDNEGLVTFTTSESPEQLKVFINESWSTNASHQVCQYLGYRLGASATLSGNIFDPVDHVVPDTHPEYCALRCAETVTNITECWYESRGFDGINQDMIIAVACCKLTTCGQQDEHDKRLGIASGDIPDSAITYSSCHSGTPCAPAGRLDSGSTWIATAADMDPWIQVSFYSLFIVTGVLTQGHHSLNRWVTSYSLSYSLDNNNWSPYLDINTNFNLPKIFPANLASNNPVGQSLYPPLMTRFIRLHPRTHLELYPMLRFELLGFGPLAEYIGDIYKPYFRCAPLLGRPLGVQNRAIIPDSAFSQEFTGRGSGFEPENARLHGPSVWSPWQVSNPGWWKVDLGNEYHVTGIITQGRSSSNEWMTSYQLALSTDELFWIKVQELECGLWKEFSANFDTDTPVTNLLQVPFLARFVRLHPRGYHKHHCLRCEVQGF